MAKDGLFICESCHHARETGEDSAAACDACGKLTCRQCLTSDGWGNPVCRDCADKRHREFRDSPDGRDQIPANHFFISLAWLGIIATSIAIPITSFRYLGFSHLLWAIPVALFALAFLFSRTFSQGGSRSDGNPVVRFFGSLIRLAIAAGIPIFLAFKLVAFLGFWNVLWVVPVGAIVVLVLTAAAMEI